MENSSYNKIKSVIDYIEDNIHDKLSLDSIAQHSGLSKFYLHKVFRVMTGSRLIDYVRNRKLAHSLHELMNTNLKVIDIANEYNFNYEQSYIRSFQRAFKISPARFRIEKPLLEVTEKLNLMYTAPIGKDGIIFEPKIIIKPDFCVIGLPTILCISNSNTPDMANEAGHEFYRHRENIKNIKYNPVFMALVKKHSHKSDLRYYIPCAEVTKVEDIPDGMMVYKIPANRYAVFKYISSLPPEEITYELKEMNEYIFRIWLNKSPYMMCDDYIIERADTSISRRDYGEYEIHVPIKQKANINV